MANRSKKLLSSIGPGAMDSWDSPVLPNNKKIFIKSIMASDINMGDHKSTEYLIRWGVPGGWEEVIYFGLTGSVHEFEINEEFEGNGSNYLNVVRKNNSSVAKRCPLIIKAFDK